MSSPQNVDAYIATQMNPKEKSEPWWRPYDPKWWLSILAIIGMTVFSCWLALSPEMIQRIGRWGYAGVFFLNMFASASIIFPIPGLPMTMAMGPAFDPWILGIVAGMGSALGELSGYIAGMTGRSLMSNNQPTQYARIQNLTKKYGASLLFIMALIPFPLFDVAGIVAGAMRMRIGSFLLAVILGKIIKFTFSILVGVSILDWLHRFW